MAWIYFGGDRDDPGNYSNRTRHNKPAEEDTKKQPLPITKGIAIPPEFDDEYYISQKQKYSKYHPEYWEWTRFGEYATAVFHFYRIVSKEFYTKYPPKSEESLPEMVNLQLKPQNCDDSFENLCVKETALIQQYARSNRTIQAKFNAHSKLRKVRDYATLAKIMFFSVKENLNVKDAIKFKEVYQNFNLQNDIDIIKAFRGCRVMQYYTKRALNLLNGKFNTIYSGVDISKAFNQLLESVNGFTSTDYDQLLSNISADINDLCTNAYCYKIIELYNNYSLIKVLPKQIKKVADNWYATNQVEFNMFYNANGEDMLEQAKYYLNLINQVLQTEGLETLFKNDFLTFKQNLEGAIDFAQPAYQQTIL